MEALRNSSVLSVGTDDGRQRCCKKALHRLKTSSANGFKTLDDSVSVVEVSNCACQLFKREIQFVDVQSTVAEMCPRAKVTNQDLHGCIDQAKSYSDDVEYNVLGTPSQAGTPLLKEHPTTTHLRISQVVVVGILRGCMPSDC